MRSISDELKKMSLMAAFHFLDKDPETNIPKLMDWVDEYIKDDVLVEYRRVIREVVEQKDVNYYPLIASVWNDIDDNVRKTLFENIVINSGAIGNPIARAAKEKYQCNIPWIIEMELKETEDEASFDFDEWDEIITQAKELGTHMYIFNGGDPLRSKKEREEIIALCNKHYDCAFLLVTDGEKYFNKGFVKDVKRVRNVVLDFRVNDADALARLPELTAIARKYKLPYTASCYYHQDGQEFFASGELLDALIACGVKIAFFLGDMDVEEDIVFDKIRSFRTEKPILTINFCSDTTIIGGCVGGGKYYSSIDSRGRLRPCMFREESDADLHECTLLEALQKPICKSYHDGCHSCRKEERILKAKALMAEHAG